MENTDEQQIVEPQSETSTTTTTTATNNDEVSNGELVDIPADDETNSNLMQSQFELAGDKSIETESFEPVKQLDETEDKEEEKQEEEEEFKEDEPVKEEEETTSSPNSITQSTVFISQSQIEDDQKPASNITSTNESSSESGNENESANNTASEEQFVELTNSVSAAIDSRVTPVDEVEKLVRHDYENLSKSQIESFDKEETALKQVEQVTAEETPKVELPEVPKRRLEDETFDKILGNDSLQKKIVEYGDGGDLARPNQGQMVTVSFEAYLNDKRDKLVDHNDNLSFILGDNDVISGLDMSVCLMELNEKAELIVEARHGYGSLGKLPDIPPNATLFIKVHLKKINEMDDLGMIRPIERLSLAEAKKLRGNFFYNRQEFHQGIISYRKGINYLLEENLRGDEEPKDLEKILELQQSIRMNLALSYFKLAECREALNLLNQVLDATQQKHIKALYIKGKVQLQLGETEDAIKSLNQSLQLDPNNAEVRKELNKAQTMRKAQYENEKRMYQKMISGVSKAEEQLDRIKSKSSQKSKQKSDGSSYVGYMAIGLLLAAASVGAALFARSRNIL